MRPIENSSIPGRKRDRSPKDSKPPKKSRTYEYSRPVLDNWLYDGHEKVGDHNDENDFEDKGKITDTDSDHDKEEEFYDNKYGEYYDYEEDYDRNEYYQDDQSKQQKGHEYGDSDFKNAPISESTQKYCSPSGSSDQRINRIEVLNNVTVMVILMCWLSSKHIRHLFLDKPS